MAIKLKTASLVGMQDLAEYQDLKATKEQLDELYQKNKAIGEESGTWHHGIRVNSDFGFLAKK